MCALNTKVTDPWTWADPCPWILLWVSYRQWRKRFYITLSTVYPVVFFIRRHSEHCELKSNWRGQWRNYHVWLSTDFQCAVHIYIYVEHIVICGCFPNSKHGVRSLEKALTVTHRIFSVMSHHYPVFQTLITSQVICICIWSCCTELI